MSVTQDEVQGEAVRAIEVELEIAAPVDAVWRALTDPRELVRWFPLEARVTPGAGGSIWIAWGGDEWEERIRVWEPGRRLGTVRAKDSWSETLHAKYEDGGTGLVPLTMDYHLEGRGGTTVLRLVHAGFQRGAAWDEEYEGTRRGWGFELRGLRHYLERHRGQDRSVAWVRLRTDAAPRDGWSRLFGANGLTLTPGPGQLREGDGYEMGGPEGESLRGVVVQMEAPTDFAGTVENMNDALLRLKVEEYAGEREVSCWLSAYGLPRERLAAFEEAWERLLRSLFPEAQPLPHVSARAS